MCGKGNDKCGFLHMMENGLKVVVDKGGVFLLFSTLYPFILHLLSTCFPHISPLCFPHDVDKVWFCCLEDSTSHRAKHPLNPINPCSKKNSVVKRTRIKRIDADEI